MRRLLLHWREEENRKEKNAQDSCFRVNLPVSVLLLIAASQKAAHWQFYTQLDKSGVRSGGSWKVQTGWRGEKKGRRVGGPKKREKKEQSVRLNVSDWTVNTVCFHGNTAGCSWDSPSCRIDCGVQIVAAPSRDAGSHLVDGAPRRHYNKYCATMLTFPINHTM